MVKVSELAKELGPLSGRSPLAKGPLGAAQGSLASARGLSKGTIRPKGAALL